MSSHIAQRQEHCQSLRSMVLCLDPGSKVLAESAVVHLVYMWCGVVWCGVVWCGVVWCGLVWCVVRSLTRAARVAHLDEAQAATALRVLPMVHPFGSSPGSCQIARAASSRHAIQHEPAAESVRHCVPATAAANVTVATASTAATTTWNTTAATVRAVVTAAVAFATMAAAVAAAIRAAADVAHDTAAAAHCSNAVGRGAMASGCRLLLPAGDA